MSEILEFLRLLWPQEMAEALSLWTLPDKASHHLNLSDREGCAAVARQLDTDWRQVYFGIGTRRQGLPSTRRGHKSDITFMPGLWIDIDLASPAHASKALPVTFEDAEHLIRAVPFEPTAIVHSGHGLHVWWLFDQPVAIPAHATIQDFERTCAALQALVIAKGAERQWHVDKTSDLARVLRLPGTTNRKLPGDIRPVTLLLADGPRHTYTAMREGLRRPVGRPAGSGKRTPDVERAAPSSVNVELIMQQLGNLADEKSRELGRRMLACESLADAGGRDEALQSACSILAFLAPTGVPEELLAFVEPSLELWAAEPDAKRSLDEERAKALDKIIRAQGDAQRKRSEDDAINDEIAEAFEADAKAAQGSGRGNDYSDEELRAICKRIHVPCSDDDNPVVVLKKRWIITHTGANFILRDTGYTKPVSKDNLMVAAMADLDRAPVRFWIGKADGNGDRKLKIGEFLENYSTVAKDSVVDLALQESYFDPVKETFHEAPCPLLRDIEPREDPRVAAWLEKLGGEHHDKLLDWIATVTLLRLPTCALYLSGPKSAGKTMLAQGLARLWTHGSATSIEQIAGQWTHDLTRCPIVLADETLPWQAGKTSAWLRAFVGGGSRTLTRKYLSSVALLGHPRLILAANNDTLLVGQEDLGGEDLAAVAARFLHIQVTQEAAKYLALLGGREGTAGWVAGGAIARHALWLRDNRDVDRGGRFLVEGEVSAMHRRLSINGRVASLVCEWLAKHLDTMSEQAQMLVKGRVVIGDGHYLVNPQAIVDAWDMYVKSAKVPSSRQVGAALANLSIETFSVNDVEVHSIRTELVLEEARRCLIGSPDKLRARLMSHPSDVIHPLTNGAPLASVATPRGEPS